MNALLKELSAIAKQKSALLKSEANLWERVAQVLEQTPETVKQHNPQTVPQLSVVSDRPAYGILRLKEVISYTGLSRSTIYKMVDERRFPNSIDLGARSVGWLEKDIEQWVRDRATQRGTRDARR